jgi:hypothetical protein
LWHSCVSRNDYCSQVNISTTGAVQLLLIARTGYYVLYFNSLNFAKFQRKVWFLSSGLKSKPSKKSAEAGVKLSDLEDGGGMFL